MSYIQIELGGQTRGLKFNQGANEIYWREIRLDLDTEAGEVYAIFYAGLRGNCIAKRIEADFTMENVQDWVDELYLTDEGKKVIRDVAAVFTETQQYKATFKALMDSIGKDDKKKAVRKNGSKSTS